MSASAAPPPGPEVWAAQYLRLIAFPAQPAFEDSREWWRGLTGIDPESSTEKRQRQEREDSGPYGGVSLSLAVDLIRIQWTASIVVDISNPPEGIPVIGNFLEKREWFRDLMARWLREMARPIKRLAFAGTLVAPVDSRRSAYERLDQYLRHVDVDPDCTDFLYRVNRPLPSSSQVSGLVVNRLATWGALMTLQYQQPIVSGRIEAPQIGRTEAHGVMLDFDINSTGERQEALPQERLPALFSELTDLILAIARDGDRRS